MRRAPQCGNGAPALILVHTDTARIRFNSKYKERDRRLAYVTAA